MLFKLVVLKQLAYLFTMSFDFSVSEVFLFFPDPYSSESSSEDSLLVDLLKGCFKVASCSNPWSSADEDGLPNKYSLTSSVELADEFLGGILFEFVG